MGKSEPWKKQRQAFKPAFAFKTGGSDGTRTRNNQIDNLGL
jgi:hypothetical protein